MKCAFINLGKHFGGAEYYLHIIIKKWIGDGNEAIVIAKHKSAFAKFIGETIPNLYIEEVDFSLYDILRIRKIFRRNTINIVNINGINSGIFINFVAANIPKITTVHSNADLDRAEKSFLMRKLFVLIENYCLRKSQRVIAVSDAIKQLLIFRGIREDLITVVNNGVKYINYPEKHFRENKEEVLKICYAGRLERVKGCEYLIGALELLESCDYQCDIYGNGSLRDELLAMVSEKQMNDRIHFKGFSTEIRKNLPQYDVLVLPSLFEAFPLTIPEAMNAKILLVCSNIGGIPWIIRDGVNGYLFEKGNIKELSEILKKIYEQRLPQKELIENAYTDFINKYTEDIMVEKTLSILKSLY
jgi:glycosyltransferase involved in cell wall biosynthesis